MKKLLTTLMCLIVLTFAVMPAEAQTRNRRQTARNAAQQSRYEQRRYERNRNDYRERSIWDKHRDKITTAGGAVGGAVIGGLVGGKKGAIIGAITGGGGAALYTYKIRKRDRNY